MKPRVKLDDIAKKAGVSKMTVSLALREDPSISGETIKKIKEIADELGYIPNRVAKSLANGKSYTIAAVVGGALHDDYHNQFLSGAINHAMERGYTLTIGLAGNDSRREATLIDKFRQMMVEGFLAFHCGDISNYELLKKSHTPFVLYTKYFQGLESDFVACDDVKGGYMMTKHLLSLGHNRIGFVYDKGLKDSSEVVNRIKGYRQAIQEVDETSEMEMLLPYQVSFDTTNSIKDNAELINALRIPDAPTALFICNDVVTSSLYILLKSIGMKIPEDISVAGYEGVYLSAILDPPLTTVASPIGEMGKRACEMLLDKIEGKIPAEHINRISLEPVLVIRNSTRRR